MLRHKFLIGVLTMVVVGAANAAGVKYAIDPTHTYPSLEFSHMGISVWRGKFDKTSGTIIIDREAKTGTVDVTIDPASINFGLQAMDEKARSDDFFNVAKYPTATYKGNLKFDGDTLKSVDGEITVMGVKKPVKLTVNSFNCIAHPVLKKEICGADVEADLNWSEFGMKLSKYGEADAGKVHLRIQVEGIKQD